MVGVLLAGGCAHIPLRATSASKGASAYALYMRGLMLERSSHLSDALDMYQQALEHDYTSPLLHVRIGATHVKLGQPEQALKSFQHALSLDPNQPDALRWMGMLYTSQGQLDEAIQIYERLITDQPKDRFLLSTLADLYVLQGQLPKGIGLYQQLIEDQGPSEQLEFNLGVLYGRLGQYPDAVTHLKKASELDPSSVDIRVALGLTYELEQNLDHAAQQYDAAIKLDQLNPRLYHHAARVASNRGRAEEAVQYYQTALDLVPSDLEAAAGLVRIWLDQRKFDDAQALVASTLKTVGPKTELFVILGLIYREADAPVEALRMFDQAVAMDAVSVQAHFYRGAQLERLHHVDEARTALRRVLELDPNHADAMNYLGYMDAEAGVNLDEAKRLIERALSIEPDNGAYLDSLGWVYYQLGNLTEAVHYLELGAKQLNNDPTVLDHLGDVYLKAGQPDKAQAAWQKALDMDAHLQTVGQKLKQLLTREATAVKPATTEIR